MQNFSSWKKRINEILENNTGLGCDCLADVNYSHLWEMGYSPFEAAKTVVRAEWGFNTPDIREDA